MTREEFIEAIESIGWKVGKVDPNCWLTNPDGERTNWNCWSDSLELDFPQQVFGKRKSHGTYGVIKYTYEECDLRIEKDQYVVLHSGGARLMFFASL